MPDFLNNVFLQIVFPLAVIAGQAWITASFKRYEGKRDEEKAEKDKRHALEAEWRADIDRRMKDHDEMLKLLMAAWATTMRSDLIHRAHRYCDDLQCASVEEKEAFHAQWEDYNKFCVANGIENHFIDNLMIAVMNLPTRDAGQRSGVDCAENITNRTKEDAYE